MENYTINSETEYHKILKEVSELIDENPIEGSPKCERLSLLADMIVEYESKIINTPKESP